MMKTFKFVVSAVGILAGVVCFCFGRVVLGVMIVGVSLALWMPRRGSGSNSGSGLSLQKKWWWLNNH